MRNIPVIKTDNQADAWEILSDALDDWKIEKYASYPCPECGRYIKASETHVDKRSKRLAHAVHDGRVSVSHLLE